MIAAGDIVVVNAASPYLGNRATVVAVSERQAKVRIIGVGDRKFALDELKAPDRVYQAWLEDVPELPVFVVANTVKEAVDRAFWAIIGTDLEGEDFDVNIIVEDEDGTRTRRHVSLRWKLVADIEIDPVQD